MFEVPWGTRFREDVLILEMLRDTSGGLFMAYTHNPVDRKIKSMSRSVCPELSKVVFPALFVAALQLD